MQVTFDREADAVYVQLSDAQVARTDILDDARFIHYDRNGVVRGLEFLWASHGVHIPSLLGVDTTLIAVSLLWQGLQVTNDDAALQVGPREAISLQQAVSFAGGSADRLEIHVSQSAQLIQSNGPQVRVTGATVPQQQSVFAVAS